MKPAITAMLWIFLLSQVCVADQETSGRAIPPDGCPARLTEVTDPFLFNRVTAERIPIENNSIAQWDPELFRWIDEQLIDSYERSDSLLSFFGIKGEKRDFAGVIVGYGMPIEEAELKVKAGIKRYFDVLKAKVDELKKTLKSNRLTANQRRARVIVAREFETAIFSDLAWNAFADPNSTFRTKFGGLANEEIRKIRTFFRDHDLVPDGRTALETLSRFRSFWAELHVFAKVENPIFVSTTPFKIARSGILKNVEVVKTEFDVVARSQSGALVIGEVKVFRAPIGKNIPKTDLDTVREFERRYRTARAAFPRETIEYRIYSTAGFEQDTADLLKAKGFKLIGPIWL